MKTSAATVSSWGAAFGLGLMLSGACSSSEGFTCQDDEACAGVGPEARCEANGFCSFADESCEGGRRYGDQAAPGLGGQCVGESMTSGPSDTSDGSDGPPPTTGNDDTDETVDDTGPPPQEPWWDCSWAARRELTIEILDLAEPLLDVPVLVVLDDSRIDPSIMAEDGHDLRFLAEDDSVVLSHEIEQWSAAGLSWAWVRVPELVPGENRLTMYYGNPGAPPTDGMAVWPSFVGVWHMDAQLADTTGNNFLLEAVGTTTSGQAASAQAFADPEGGIRMETTPVLDGLFGGGGTISAMVRPSSTGGGGNGLIVGRADNDNGDDGWVFQIDLGDQAVRFARGFAMNRRIWTSPTGSVPADSWHHIAVVYDDGSDTNDPVLYVDGVPQPLDTSGVGNGAADPELFPFVLIGGEPVIPDQWFPGIIDEVRISAIPRTDDWMRIQAASLRDDLIVYGAPSLTPCAGAGQGR